MMGPICKTGEYTFTKRPLPIDIGLKEEKLQNPNGQRHIVTFLMSSSFQNDKRRKEIVLLKTPEFDLLIYDALIKFGFLSYKARPRSFGRMSKSQEKRYRARSKMLKKSKFRPVEESEDEKSDSDTESEYIKPFIKETFPTHVRIPENAADASSTEESEDSDVEILNVANLPNLVTQQVSKKEEV